MQSINPKNLELLAQFDEMSWEHVLEITDFVDHAFKDWRNTPFETRSELLMNLASELRKGANLFAQIITDEMGKVIPESKAEVLKCATVCEYYAEKGPSFLSNERVVTDMSESFVSYQPLGVVLAIMPWNFPFWQVLRFAAPTLMAGNTCLLKHAPNVTQCALEIESLFYKAGFPDNVFRTLIMDHTVVDDLLENPKIKAVTLTGSTRAGKSVAKKAGSVIKRSVLELGGSDPYLILGDAQLLSAADKCVKSRLINSGQSCVAAKRFIVVDEVYEEFLKIFTDKMEAINFGDPLTGVHIGPLARIDLRDELHRQVSESIKKGAVCLLGGEIPKLEGAYYPPTLLSEVKEGMPAYSEELFGPVASLIRAKDEQDAIRIANDTSYGLGAAVFTSNFKRGIEIAEKELRAGNCFVNDFVKSDPRLPFGGVGESGFGRELGLFGIREFVNIKTVAGQPS